MDLFGFEDEVNEIAVMSEKANAIAEYLKETYFGKRPENVDAEILKYNYEAASMFMDILHDYSYAAVEKLNNLCDAIPEKFAKGDEKK